MTLIYRNIAILDAYFVKFYSMPPDIKLLVRSDLCFVFEFILNSANRNMFQNSQRDPNWYFIRHRPNTLDDNNVISTSIIFVPELSTWSLPIHYPPSVNFTHLNVPEPRLYLLQNPQRNPNLYFNRQRHLMLPHLNVILT